MQVHITKLNIHRVSLSVPLASLPIPTDIVYVSHVLEGTRPSHPGGAQAQNINSWIVYSITANEQIITFRDLRAAGSSSRKAFPGISLDASECKEDISPSLVRGSSYTRFVILIQLCNAVIHTYVPTYLPSYKKQKIKLISDYFHERRKTNFLLSRRLYSRL